MIMKKELSKREKDFKVSKCTKNGFYSIIDEISKNRLDYNEVYEAEIRNFLDYILVEKVYFSNYRKPYFYVKNLVRKNFTWMVSESIYKGIDVFYCEDVREVYFEIIRSMIKKETIRI
jgi:hypothetical protein